MTHPFTREPLEVSRYIGGTCAAVLHPRSSVQRPALVGASEQFIVRGDGERRSYRPAVSTIVLPEAAHWKFERADGVLRIGLQSPHCTGTPSGFVGLLHDSGNLFVDRLRTRHWVPESAPACSHWFRAIRPDELPTTSALQGERFVESRGLVLLRASDVLCACGDAACQWFTIEWPEPDLERAVRDLQAHVRTNGSLLTDRITCTISTELLASDQPGQFTIPLSDELPDEQGVKVLSVTHSRRRLRNAVELGDWDVAAFRVEAVTRFSGLLARVHCPGNVANALIELVRFPRVRPPHPGSQRQLADSVHDDGSVAAAEFMDPVEDLLPSHHTVHRLEALRQVVAHYPRYELRRLLLGVPECGEAAFWPSARGLQAVLPTTLRLRPEPHLSERDFADLASDVDEYLGYHLAGPFHFRCRFEVNHVS